MQNFSKPYYPRIIGIRNDSIKWKLDGESVDMELPLYQVPNRDELSCSLPRDGTKNLCR
jgi:hypothetical protein